MDSYIVLVVLNKVYCFFNYGLIVFVLVCYDGVDNVMVVVWVCVFDFLLLKLMVVFDKFVKICEFVECSGMFVIQVLMVV